MKLRIQHKAKKYPLVIADDANLGQLIELINTLLGEADFSFKSGYPPRALDVNDLQRPLSTAGIRSGETLIVELNSGAPLSQAVSSTSLKAKEVPKPMESGQEVFKASGRREGEILQETFSFGGKHSGSASSPAVSDPSLPPEIAVTGRGIITLRVQPDDNSCLFRAIGYLCMRSIDAMEELRQIIASTIQERPEEYSDAVLGMKRDLYCRKMNRADTWGGEIEMKILSDYFNVQIASIDCKSGHIYRYGESFNERIYIVYSGIHYDAIALAPSTAAPPDWDQTQFDAGDETIEAAAINLVSVLRKRNYFTDTANFDLRCADCGAGLVGEKGAQEHAQKTGHVNFGEYRSLN